MVDVHAHLTDQKFDDVEQVVSRAEECGVDKIICSAYSFLSSQQAIDLSKQFKLKRAVNEKSDTLHDKYVALLTKPSFFRTRMSRSPLLCL